jgi:Carboxypeptidase regulatory-like domain/TonB dependent receptor
MNSWRNSISARLVIAFLALILAGSTTHAQILYGSLTGTVTDTSGAVIPNVIVTITNQGTGEVRTEKTSSLGVFTLLDLMPGTYNLSIAKASSFAGFAQKDVQIEVNRQVRIDVTLQTATVSTQITVTEAAPELQTETAEVNSEINQTQLSQLPITGSEGRSYQSLYNLIPGASDVQEKNSVAGNPSRAMSVNVNGNSYNGNTTRIDGAVNYYGWLPYLIAYVPPADSIESVSFTTNDFDAEQGQAGGASIKVTTKSGTKDFHGSVWEYYQDGGINARGYTATQTSLISALNPTGSVPKNVFNEYGFNIGGPVYLPRVLTGKKKLFFFENFERITRRQLISGTLSVPDSLMTTGNFSEPALAGVTNSILYDPAPTVPSSQWIGSINSALCPTLSYSNGYLNYPCRPSFTNEYGETGSNVNTIPNGSNVPGAPNRISQAAQVLMKDLAPIANAIGTPSGTVLTGQMGNDYNGTGTFGYNRNSNDAKITYIPNESTQIFGKYGIAPYSGTDPQELGAAGGGTFDGGQPGAAAGRVQNVEMGMSHVISSRLVIDADFGYTRQRTGAQSTLDQTLPADYGATVLGIPGTNGPGPNYEGQPAFDFTTLTGLGNTNGSNPFLFRDNQFTGDVNLSWLKGNHSTKYGITYYHFDLNHFQPTSGSGVNVPRGGFEFQGGMTCGDALTASSSACGVTSYTSLADFLLGLPNNGTGQAIGHPEQVFNPNALRWTEFGAYAQDQWTVTPKLTLTYGVRYEIYPPAYRDHTGATVLVPGLPQTANVEVGGINGNPENAGISIGYGFFAPRVGVAYRLNEKTVLRTGAGLTSDPDSMRYLRDSFPEDLAPSYSGTGTGTIAVDPANANAPMTLAYGIPNPIIPNYSSGFASLPIAGTTTTVAQKFRRGYIESWNLFLQRDIGHDFVANVGYVGTHFVRQQVGWSPYNAAPFASSSTTCMPDGQVNPSTGLNPGGTGLPCSSVGGININETINLANCPPGTLVSGKPNLACYNTGGITYTEPLWSSSYNALQSQLSRNAGKNASLGLVYTYSHAVDYEDNGAGSGSQGTVFNFPAMARFNRGTAGYDERHNLQFWSVYSLPFGPGQRWANHGLIGEAIGGFQLNGNFFHISGLPFAVSANSNTIGGFAPGFGATYAQLTGSYKQLSGHIRNAGSNITGGKTWFDTTTFSNPVEPGNTLATNPSNTSPTLPNTGRNQFRGPGVSMFNMSLFKGFHVYRESEFQVRVEAFNLFNHPWLNNPGATYGSATFGMITSYGPPYSPTQGARSLQFGGRFNF